nr:MAG TPA: hypothetical protein [Caudoviricetes sp.]
MTALRSDGTLAPGSYRKARRAPSDRVKPAEGALFLCPGGFHMKHFL